MGHLKSFIKNNKAIAAIEFAIIAPVFFLIFMGIVEIGLTTFLDSALNSGIRAAAREGVAKGMTEAQVREKMEAHMAGLYRTDDADLMVKMIVVDDVDQAGLQTLKFYADEPTQFFLSNNGFPTVNQQKGKIAVYGVRYKWNGFTNIMKGFLPNVSCFDYSLSKRGENTQCYLYAFAAVKNEAFNAGAP